MLQNRKWLSGILSLTLVCLIASACGSSTNSNTAKESASIPASEKTEATQVPPEEQITLKMATWQDMSYAEKDKAALQIFMKQHPNIKVEYETWGGNYDDKLSLAIASNDLPDIMTVWDFPKYYKAFEPLDDYLAKEPDLKNDFLGKIMSYSMFGGKTYGLPTGWTGRVIYYNKKLFDEAGVPYPQEGWSYQDLREAAKKLTNPSKGQSGLALDTDLYVMQDYFWNNGADLLNEDGTTSVGYLNSQASKDVIEKIYTLYKTDKSTLLNIAGDSGTTSTAINTVELFKAGKVAMIDNGNWQQGDFIKAGIDFGIVTVPTWSEGVERVGLLHAASVGVSVSSKHKDATWELAKFLTSKEYLELVTDFSARKSVNDAFAQDDKLKSRTSVEPLNEMQFKTINASTVQPLFLRNDNWSEAQRIIQHAIQKIMLNNDDIGKTLDNLTKEVDTILNKK